MHRFKSFLAIAESTDSSHDHHHTSSSKIDVDKHNAGKGIKIKKVHLWGLQTI